MRLCSSTANLQPRISKSRAIYFCQKRQAVHCSDVEKIVSSLSTKKVPGHDKIPIHVINISAPVIIPSITAIINSSFTTSTYSGDWKIAKVSPILKEGDFEEPGNNRPITLLPIFPKVCEKAVLNQLTPYLKTNKWLAVEQNRKKSDTPLKLLLLSLFYGHCARGGRQEKANSYYIYVDMSKAFNSINHSIFLRKRKADGAGPFYSLLV